MSAWLSKKMARYPTFEEYEKTGRYKDGIKRINEFLKKAPKDVQLLTTKLQLLCADNQDGKAVLDQLFAIEPTIQDLSELYQINAAVVQSQHNVWPRPTTVGPEVAKLWENAVKASSMQHKLDLLVQRFESSVEANYMVDAQQVLIQLKALQPKNRAIYMAHAAVTQLISTSKDDMQSRLALMLAKKAVTENFDEDKDLDCRVPGQIFALQGSMKDSEVVRERRFGESKQAYEALRDAQKAEANGSTPRDETTTAAPAATPTDWLLSETADLKARFKQLVDSSAGLERITTLAESAMNLFQKAMQSAPSSRSRAKAEACFIAISSLVKAYEFSKQPAHLLISAHLAEILLTLDPHIHEARLVLVYLYMRLGLGSEAVKYFDSLSVKEVQLDTVGHTLFTDLSYTHPHQLPMGSKETRNALSRAKNAVQVYERCEDKLCETEASVLSNGQTGMIFDLHELRDNLRSSVTKRIIFLEIRRQARICFSDSAWHTKDLGPKRVGNWIETRDNRDFAATFDYGYNVERALYGRNGEIAGRRWILSALAADAAWCLASGKEADSPVHAPEELIKEFESDAPDMGELKIDDQGDRTSSRCNHLAAEVACQVLRLLLLVRSETKDSTQIKAKIEAVSQAVNNLSVTTLCETNDTCTERLREHFLYFDILKIAARACAFTLKEGGSKECEAEIMAVEQKCNDDVAALGKHAEEQKQRVNAAGIKSAMREEQGVFAALEAFGEDGVQRFCEAVETAAKDGWAGLGKLKM